VTAAENERFQRSIVFEALSSVGGVAALALGGLYVLGIALTSAELTQANVSLADALQFFPLENILRTGLRLVLPALVGLAGSGLLLLASWRIERRMLKLAIAFRKQETPHQSQSTREEWARVLTQAEEQTDWTTVGSRLKQSLSGVPKSGQAERRKTLLRLRRALRAWNLWGLLILVVVYSPLLFLPSTLVWPVVVIFGVVGTVVLKRPRPVQQELPVLYSVMLIAFIASALLYPRPLPEVSLLTDNEAPLSGKLLLVADSKWYVGVANGVIRVVPEEHVECTQVIPQRPTTRVLDEFRKVERPRQPSRLTCERIDSSSAKGRRKGSTAQ